MPRAVWKGAISFGLVHVPVALYPASQENEVDFDWLDRRSMDPVGYKRVNKRTGKEITKEDIVKGVKQDDGTYVVLSDDEVKEAYPRTTQTIEIEDFVPANEISFAFIEKPYYLEPSGRADKVYALLREAMAGGSLLGIARMVMHNKEHLVALVPAGPALMLGTLRWANEIRPVDDRFTDALRKLIAAKAKAGESKAVEPLEEAPSYGDDNVIDLAELLKSSLGQRKSPKQSAGSERKAAASGKAADPKASRQPEHAAAKTTRKRKAA